MPTRRAFAATVLGFVFLLTAVRSDAQEVDAAIVVGTVLDSGQAAVTNASVKLTHLATNSVVEVHTNERGEFRTPPLRLGEYEISVEAAGFKRFNQKGVVLNIGDVRQVDAILEVGELSQSVTVESAAPLLQTEDSTVGTVITNQEITELPLNGRNYQQLALLSAGTVPPLVNNVGISIGGQPSAQVAYLLDGQDNNNQGMSPSGNAGQKDIVEPSIDALQEFKVVTNGYSAEYGRSSSGVISAAIKSGSNEFHGEGFEFVRNAALDAENYFTPADSPKPPFGRNQFGGAIGGPIIHDKTFFFGDVEFGRIRETYTSVNSLPDAAELAGQFPAGPGDPVVYDPSTPGVAFPIVNGQYVIPAGIIDPISQKVVNLLISAGADPQTAAANNFVYASPEDTNARRWDVRVDQILSEKQNLYFRYSSQVDDLGITSLLPPAPGEGYFSYGPASSKTGAQTVDGTSFVLGFNRVWSPTLVTSVLAGWNDLFWNNTLPNQNLTGIGIPGVNETNPGFSGLLITGLPSLGVTNVPNTDISQNRQLSGNLTWTKGSHSVKFGVQEYWLQTNFHSSQTAGGTFTFNGQYTGDPSQGGSIGNPFADFLLGDASAASLSTYANLNFRIPETNLFVQDDWKVNRHLTLNIGLRYEITPPAVDVHNAIANYEMNTDPYVGTPQLVLAGANGSGIASRALQNVDYHQFAPRLGFAYSVGDKTVIRGGYGIFYSNVITVGGMSSMEKNPPDSVVVNENPSKTVPSVFLQDGFAVDALTIANAKNVQLVSFDQRSVPPTDYQWNLNVQRQLPGGFLLEVGYVGNNFDHNWWSIDGNPAPVTADPIGSLNSRRIFTSAAVPGTPYTISLSNVKRIQKSGYSRYNALQTKLEKRYANGLSLIASYSYSKTMALGDAAGLQNPLDWAAEYAVAGQDVTQHFVGSAIYELPFGRSKKFGDRWNGVTNAFFGGWAIDPIVTASTGFPVNLTESTDPSNTGQNDRPNVVGDWHLANPTVNEWFNTAAFVVNAPGTFGDAKRNLLRAPGLFNVDLAAHKSFQLTERVSAQLRVESFNFTNTPAFAAPDAIVTDTLNFGKIQSAGNPRQIQLGMKVLF
jgi:hypothetical protein